MGRASLKDAFVESASRRGESRAISFFRGARVETEISFRGLHLDSNRMAHFFLDLGIEKGDRVILFLQKSLIWVTAHLALQKVGAISVPLNPGFKGSEMAYFLQDAEPRLVLCGPEQEAMLEELDPALERLLVDTKRRYQDLDLFSSASEQMPPVEVGSQDPALIIYTSGTTGRPKGAILTQSNLLHDAQNVIKTWEVTESDVLCHVLPLFHVHGLCFALHTCLVAGSHVVLVDKFSPETVLDLLSRREGKYVCTLFMAVPSMYAKLMEHVGDRQLDFGHVRLWTSGSAPLLPEDFERIRKVFGKEPVEREGMSETGMNFSNPIKGPRKPGSIGLPLPDLQVRIVDPETLQDVPPGEEGEIWLRGPCVTPGYWRKPEETARSFHGEWFRTGDLGRVDGQGYYYLTDRIKDIIISGGENVSPKEVEMVINQLRGVLDSSVVGIPDERWGERVVAAVVTRPGVDLSPKDVKDFCKRHLHDWKCPKEVMFLRELPRNTMGKVLREDIRRLFST